MPQSIQNDQSISLCNDLENYYNNMNRCNDSVDHDLVIPRFNIE
jgi:hypothetical protein